MSNEDLPQMLDSKIRPWIDPPLNRIAKYLVQRRVSATALTLTGFALGFVAFVLIATAHYQIAAIFILLNRSFDGLDGAVARHSKVTYTGAYLDIVLDFIFYGLIVLGFAIAQAANALMASLLIFSFMASSSAFLAQAIFAEKLNIESNSQGRKSFYYMTGLAEGFETIVSFLLMCLWPAYFAIIAGLFTILCLVSTLFRIKFSISMLSSYDKQKAEHPM